MMLENIKIKDIDEKIAALIDKSFLENENMANFHKENKFKNYCFDLPYPIESDGIYKKEKIYTITIRTIDSDLAKFFNEVSVNTFTKEIKGLVSEVKIIPKKPIDKLYSLKPVISKGNDNRWIGNITVDRYEDVLKINLIKKWNSISDKKISDDFQFNDLIVFDNKHPISFKYKSLNLLGDKIELKISSNKTAQDLAYMAIGTGIMQMNARGAGFVGYKYL